MMWRGDLAEQVLVDVAHDVLVVEVEGLDVVHDLREHLGGGDEEDRVLHVAREGGVASLADLLDEREDVVLHRLEHLAGLEVAEAVPAEVGVGGLDARLLGDHADAVLEHALLQRDAQRRGVRLGLQLVVVQQLHEHQVRDLLQHRDGAGDATGPDGLPDLVDLVSQFACYHGRQYTKTRPTRQQLGNLKTCQMIMWKNGNVANVQVLPVPMLPISNW